MQQVILCIAAVVLLGSVLMLNNQPLDQTLTYKAQFEVIKTKYGKSYTKAEEAYRLSVYASNVEYIREYNANKGKNVFGETIFFDLTKEEFKSTYLVMPIEQMTNDRVTLNVDSRMDNIDWVSKGYVTNIKNQGGCGSCWAFSTTGVLEGYFKRTEGQLYDLSEKQLLDCSRLADLNMGCNGGLPSRALNYVKRNGITDQDSYPYKPVQEDCAIKGGTHKINGHTTLAATEAGLIGGLQLQPISVTVDASNWFYYDPLSKEYFQIVKILEIMQSWLLDMMSNHGRSRTLGVLLGVIKGTFILPEEIPAEFSTHLSSPIDQIIRYHILYISN